MSFISETIYAVKCDDCGELLEDREGLSFFPTITDAQQRTNAIPTKDDNGHLCETCHEKYAINIGEDT